jgi:hypothetical protein
MKILCMDDTGKIHNVPERMLGFEAPATQERKQI